MKPILKTLMLGGIFLMINVTIGNSAEMYVTDVLKLTVRAGQTNNDKIVNVIESGQRVSLLRTDKEWAFIRLSDKKEGWVQRQYLSSRQPSRFELKKLKTKHNNLVLQSAALLEENGTLKEKNKNLLDELNNSRQRLSALNDNYTSLKDESTDFLKLKSAHEETTAKLSVQTGQLKSCRKRWVAWKMTALSFGLPSALRFS